VYIRMSEEENHARVDGGGFTVLRRGTLGAPLVVAVGPTLTSVLGATADRDVGVAYLATVRPFPHDGVRDALGDGTDVVLVEPYQAGTSAAEVAVALRDRPHRLLALGVPNAEFRHYGTGEEHRTAHGLDAAGLMRSLDGFLG
jgi:transketolase